MDPIVGEIPDVPTTDTPEPEAPPPKPKVVVKWRSRTVYRKGYSLRAMALSFAAGGIVTVILATIAQLK